MHRAFATMGGLPRRAPVPATIALLTAPVPPAQSGGPKKSTPQGPPAGHKCSRCKTRPKSGSGSSLCIRCKLQREYGSPRGGFAAPRKKIPSAMQHPPQPATIASASGALIADAAASTSCPAATNRVDAVAQSKLEVQRAQTIHLEVAGEPSLRIDRSKLRSHPVLTESEWSSLKEELEHEQDDFLPEDLDQTIEVKFLSGQGLPVNVALPAEIVGTIEAAGSSTPQVGGVCRPTPMLAPAELAHAEVPAGRKARSKRVRSQSPKLFNDARESIRLYGPLMEAAFNALNASTSQAKWVTILSVYQKKAVLAKIFERLADLEQKLLPPAERNVYHRVSRSMERLFTSMNLLRGRMQTPAQQNHNRNDVSTMNNNVNNNNNNNNNNNSVNNNNNNNNVNVNNNSVNNSNNNVNNNNNNNNNSNNVNNNNNNNNNVNNSNSNNNVNNSNSNNVNNNNVNHNNNDSNNSSINCTGPCDVNVMPQMPQFETLNQNASDFFNRSRQQDAFSYSATSVSIEPEFNTSSQTAKSLKDEADEEIKKILDKLQSADRNVPSIPEHNTQNIYADASSKTNVFSHQQLVNRSMSAQPNGFSLLQSATAAAGSFEAVAIAPSYGQPNRASSPYQVQGIRVWTTPPVATTSGKSRTGAMTTVSGVDSATNNEAFSSAVVKRAFVDQSRHYCPPQMSSASMVSASMVSASMVSASMVSASMVSAPQLRNLLARKVNPLPAGRAAPGVQNHINNNTHINNSNHNNNNNSNSNNHNNNNNHNSSSNGYYASGRLNHDAQCQDQLTPDFMNPLDACNQKPTSAMSNLNPAALAQSANFSDANSYSHNYPTREQVAQQQQQQQQQQQFHVQTHQRDESTLCSSQNIGGHIRVDSEASRPQNGPTGGALSTTAAAAAAAAALSTTAAAAAGPAAAGGGGGPALALQGRLAVNPQLQQVDQVSRCSTKRPPLLFRMQTPA